MKPTSDPTSRSYGKYPSLSTLQSEYGASSSRRKGVANAFKQQNGVRLAIVGEASTPAADVHAFRSCFGATGTALKIHNARSIKPILESSLDAMVAPRLTMRRARRSGAARDSCRRPSP